MPAARSAPPSSRSRPAGSSSDSGELGRQAAKTIRHPLTRALLLLTFSTGLVDASSYLGLGHVFTANMTGNVVLLGFGIAGAAGLPVVAPLVSLVAFLLGAAAGGLLVARLTANQERSLYGALSIETLLVAVAAVLAAAVQVRPGGLSASVVIALVAFAMGLRNATVRKLAVPDLSTTVLTMTLTGLASDSRLAGGSGAGTVRRSSAVISMLVGAVCGALLLRVDLWLVLVAVAALALATQIAYRTARRPPPERSRHGGSDAR
ncbi:MAG TPA: YoaK family protein [Solirubrobacteraceae bacterium]